MHHLHCTISHGLWQALQRHYAATGESLGHIVRTALAEYLHVSHSTLFQVSTSAALVQGVYQGAVRVGTLREHGDHGLGTFEQLDGEMVVIDGRCFQVRSDGSVHSASCQAPPPRPAVPSAHGRKPPLDDDARPAIALPPAHSGSSLGPLDRPM